mmetsp:Transcript_7313/g.11135  ORF Transcript_7313/g.11135 Transcript_7313/m.11135 type:complete len:93 (-) Transcript_7313:104-382(-)
MKRKKMSPPLIPSSSFWTTNRQRCRQLGLGAAVRQRRKETNFSLGLSPGVAAPEGGELEKGNSPACSPTLLNFMSAPTLLYYMCASTLLYFV